MAINGNMNKESAKKEAERIWNKLLSFSSYGFNKSHSAAYSVMSYWCQYLKANYPLEFWTSALQYADSEIEIPNRISEMNKLKLNIVIKPPDINKSHYTFTCDKETNTIYWSLSKIKNLGVAAIKHIFEVRKKYGDFDSLEEFVNRVQKNKVNKAKIIYLILSGAFDNIHNIVDIRKRIELIQWYKDFIKEDIQNDERFNTSEINKEHYWILLQRELTGFGFINYEKLISTRTKDRKFLTNYTSPEDFYKPNQDWQEAVIAGTMIQLNEYNSKKGTFAKLVINSNNNLINCVVWSEVYKENIELFQSLKNKMVAISGSIKKDDWVGGNGQNQLMSNKTTKIIEIK